MVPLSQESQENPNRICTLRPDLDTFAILPWRPQQGKVARLLCDIYCPDGTPHERSPRYILKKTAREAKKEGYTCLVDPECEFFLFIQMITEFRLL